MPAPNIFSPQFEDDLISNYRDLRENYPVLYDPANGFIVSRYEDISKVLKDAPGRALWQVSSLPGETTDTSIDPGKLPGIPERIHIQVVQVLEKNVMDLLSRFKAGLRINFVAQFAGVYPLSAYMDLFGLSRVDIPLLQHIQTEIWNAEFSANKPATVSSKKPAVAEIDAYLRAAIHRKKAEPGNDLLSFWISQGWSDEMLVATAGAGFLFGGLGVEQLLVNAVKNLLTFPQELKKLRQGPHFIHPLVVETLRISPSLPLLSCQVRQNLQLSGGMIEKNSKVICLLEAAYQDEAQFSAPGLFTIDREELQHKPVFHGGTLPLVSGNMQPHAFGLSLGFLLVEVAIDLLSDTLRAMRLVPAAIPGRKGWAIRETEVLTLEYFS